MNTNWNNYSDRLATDDEFGGWVEWIWMDYDKKEVFLSIIDPESWKLININPKIFVTSIEELAYIRVMESGWFYYMWVTDDDWNIPEHMFDLFKCTKDNTHVYPKYPPYKNCNMIFIEIPWMWEKEDSFRDIRENVKKELFWTQEEIKAKVRVLCNSWITYGNIITRKPIKQYKMLKKYY